MPSYTYKCSECESTNYHICKFEDRPEVISCACGGQAEYRIDSPMPMLASFRDGYRRPGWQEMKEASRLSRESAVSKPDKKKEIAKEIRRLGVRINKGD